MKGMMQRLPREGRLANRGRVNIVMGPSQCPSCHGTDLYWFLDYDLIDLRAHSERVTIPLSFSDSLPVKCSVCLSCGFVAPYLARADLERLRAHRAKGSQT